MKNSVTAGLSSAVILFYCFSAPGLAYGGPGGGTPVPVTSLKESILFAFGRDPSISQQAGQLGVGQAKIEEAQSGWMPQVGLNGNIGHNQTTDSSGSLKNSAAWGLSLTQLLYDFGKTDNAISQSTAERDGYRYQLMSTLSAVAEKTALSYVEVKRYTDLVRAAQENVQALQSVQNLAQIRSEAGLSSTSDELQTRTRIAGMQSVLEQYKSALQSARARLTVLTGIEAKHLSPLPVTLEVKPGSLDDIDYSLIPAVLAASAMERSAQYGIERAKSEHWPTLSLQAGRTRYESDNRSYWDDQIQLHVDAPLYQGGAVSARVRQAEGTRQMAASQVNQARFDVLQKASVAQADWAGARGRMAASALQRASALRTRDVYKNEYTLSKRSINDLLSIEQDVWQATSSTILAEYDSWAAAIDYTTAVDKLLPLAGIENNAASVLPELR